MPRKKSRKMSELFYKKLSSQIFQTQKNNCDANGQKVKKHVFFKTFFDFSKLDIFGFIKMSNF
jgi:hypothetical protein